MRRKRRKTTSAVHEARSAAIRTALVEAASTIANEEGLHGLTIRGVAKEAGCSIASVYAYFEDRDALIDGIVDGSLQRIGAAVRAPLPPSLTFEERLLAFLQGAQPGRQRFSHVFAELSLPRPDVARPAARLHEGIRALTREWVATHATPADLGVRTVEEAGAALFALMRCFSAAAALQDRKWNPAPERTKEVFRALLAWVAPGRQATAADTEGARAPATP